MEIIKEDTDLLKYYVNNYFRKNNIKKPIHLIVRPECNQKCEYCYLYQHGEELYPKHLRKDTETLLNNLKMLLTYLQENNIYENFWEIFAGDLFYDNFWFDIMDKLYLYFNSMINNNVEPLNDENAIIIPCNMSFCDNLSKVEKVEEYVNKFKDINFTISFSYSTDGKYAEQIREKKTVSDEFYDRVFKLMKKYHWQAHPMISYESIKNGVQNYKWWRDQYDKYFRQESPNIYLPSFLEVRNDGWTTETLDYLIHFLDYAVEDRFKLLDYDIQKFTKHLFYSEEELQKEHILMPLSGNDFLKIVYKVRDDNFMRCCLGFFFSINLGELSFIPCHRLNYTFFKGGHFIVENNKITDIIADEGINGFFLHKITNTQFNLDCYGCQNRYFCKAGCRGAQFEYNTEAFMPIPSVCALLNTELTFLIKKYHTMGVFHCLFSEINYNMDYQYKKDLIQLLSAKGYPEYEFKYA